MGERNDARREIEASRARMTVIADELARRSSPDYLKDRAREQAMSKATQARDRMASNPGVLAALGAAAGGALGMALGKKAQKSKSEDGGEQRYYQYRQSPWETSERTWTADQGYVAQPGYAPQRGEAGFASTYGTTYESTPDYSASPEAGSWSEPWRSQQAERSWEHSEQWESREPSKGEQMKGRAQDMKERAGHKAQDVKERASHKAHDMKERASHKAHEMKARMSDKTDEMKHKMQEKRSGSHEGGGLREKMPSPGEMHRTAQRRPLGTILGGALLGIAAASLLPLTRKEKKVMHPAKERAREELGDQIHKVEEKFGMGGHEEEEASSRSSGRESSRGESSRGFEDERRFSQQREEARGYGAPVDSGTSRAGPGGFPTTEASGERESMGLRSSREAEQPYRQPSFAEQLEEEDKIH